MVLQKVLVKALNTQKAGLPLVSDKEIYGVGKDKRPEKLHQKSKLIPLPYLGKRDYVVHETYGIGKYLGIETPGSK